LLAPPDLLQGLTQAGAMPGWAAYPKSVRRGTLEWIKTARTETSRAARIANVVDSAADRRRPRPYRKQA